MFVLTAFTPTPLEGDLIPFLFVGFAADAGICILEDAGNPGVAFAFAILI
jgi:hypothetical protein